MQKALDELSSEGIEKWGNRGPVNSREDQRGVIVIISILLIVGQMGEESSLEAKREGRAKAILRTNADGKRLDKKIHIVPGAKPQRDLKDLEDWHLSPSKGRQLLHRRRFIRKGGDWGWPGQRKSEADC